MKIIIILLISILSFTAYSEDPIELKIVDKDYKLKQDNFKPYAKDIEKRMQRKKNPFFNLDLNIQGGVTISDTDFDVNDTSTAASNLENTSSKVGPTAGAVLSIDLLGFGFTTGVVYNSKGFEIINNSTGSEENVNMNYLNLPLLIHFDFEVGRVIIDGNVGPYFGLLLGDEETEFYKIKNFDLGLTGNLQFAYMFNQYLGALLGGKFEYGGLNNLGNNGFINSIRSKSYHIYTGMKFNI